MKKAFYCIILLTTAACTPKASAPVIHISLVNNNQSVKLTGLYNAIASDISRDSVSAVWETLMPVYRMPADTDLKNYQPVQHGTYILKSNAVVFTPDSPFIKGHSYFMRYHIFKGENVWDYIKGKKRLGTVGYSDLVIKL